MIRYVLILLTCGLSCLPVFSQPNPSSWFWVLKHYELSQHKAIAMADSLTQLKPDDMALLQQHALLLYKAGSYGRAYQAFEKLIDSDPAFSYEQMAMCALEQHDTLRWFYNMQKLSELPVALSQHQMQQRFPEIAERHPALWKQWWAQRYVSSNNTTAAMVIDLIENRQFIEALEKLREISGKEWQHEIYRLNIKIFTLMGDKRTAIQTANKAIKKFPNDFGIHLVRAGLLHQSGKWKQACEAYSHCIRINPYLPDLYVKRAIVCNNAGNYTQALSDLSLYLGFFDNDTVRFSRAIVLINTFQHDLAIEELSKLIANNPSVSKYFVNRGNCFYSLKQYLEASNDYSMALDIDPNEADAWFKMGWSFYHLEQYERACFCWKKSKPSHPEAERLINSFCK